MNNYSKYRLSLYSILLLIVIGTGCSKTKKEKTEKIETPPNIILFLVDDMGWQDTSLPFWKEETPLNRRFNTPAMERLAEDGMMFTQAYASPICSPTRVSLMSGMNAARHRVTNWTLYRDASVDAKSDILTFPEWNVNGLQPSDSIERSVHVTTLPQILKDNGYYTIHCGKAHFGAFGTDGADPKRCGFDVNIAGHAAGGPGSFLGEENFGNKEKGGHTEPWGIPGLEQYHGDSIFLSEALTLEAIKALDTALIKEKPFYLYMSHYAVHIPYKADKRFYQKYIDMGLAPMEAMYSALVEGMDKSLADLMDYVKNRGIEDNTIIMFMSDNGGFSLSPRDGKAWTHNLPLNGGKGSLYEGGIREPMIVKWPGKVKPKTECDDYLLIEDFFPTILEMAGVKNYNAVQHIDGISFMPMLTGSGTTSTDRDLIWHVPNNWGPKGHGSGTNSAIRRGDWKLIYWYKDSHFDLFNIKDDIGETDNLVDKNPAKVKELAKALGEYLRDVEAQRPTLKSSNTLAPWPDHNFTKE